MRVIGWDCATDDVHVGVARGEYHAGRLEVFDVQRCSVDRTAAAVLAEWLRDTPDALIAVDAPLGWPVSMGTSLAAHNAGDAILPEPDRMFRRETDRFVREHIGKTPLDVGADRIARTAHKALSVLGVLRRKLDIPIPLAWDPSRRSGVTAIEVYPAATLKARGLPFQGYKKPEQREQRAEIFGKLDGVLDLRVGLASVLDSADALDAIACLLAARDFLDGSAMGPADETLAKREGWIWTIDARNIGSSAPGQPFSVEPRDMAVRPGIDIDRANQLVDELEANEVRRKLYQ